MAKFCWKRLTADHYECWAEGLDIYLADAGWVVRTRQRASLPTIFGTFASLREAKAAIEAACRQEERDQKRQRRWARRFAAGLLKDGREPVVQPVSSGDGTEGGADGR